jgi:hypothetical protein
MGLQAALKEQYHAGLAMLADCIGRCPAEMWASPNPVGGSCQRAFWRIAFHAVYFTHLYLGQSDEAFQPPPAESVVGGREEFRRMWQAPGDLEPYELAEDVQPLNPAELMEYLAYVDGLIDPVVDTLDLSSPESGFYWYRNISKLSHELLNLRHLQGHVGQLSELLMLQGIDSDWISRRRE